MAADAFVSQLNEQIAHEFAAHQQYVACAVYYDALTMPQMAGFFYAQALEERGHAMMMVQYLIDSDAPVVIPGVEAPVVVFEDLVAPVALALTVEAVNAGYDLPLDEALRFEATAFGLAAATEDD